MHHIVLILCLTAVLGGLLLQYADDGLYLFGWKWPSTCALHSRFGIKCALCGLTRSFSMMAHGHLARAFAVHALGPAIFAFCCLQIPYRAYALAIAPRRPNQKFVKYGLALGVLLIVAIFVNWFVYLGGLIL